MRRCREIAWKNPASSGFLVGPVELTFHLPQGILQGLDRREHIEPLPTRDSHLEAGGRAAFRSSPLVPRSPIWTQSVRFRRRPLTNLGYLSHEDVTEPSRKSLLLSKGLRNALGSKTCHSNRS